MHSLFIVCRVIGPCTLDIKCRWVCGRVYRANITLNFQCVVVKLSMKLWLPGSVQACNIVFTGDTVKAALLWGISYLHWQLWCFFFSNMWVVKTKVTRWSCWSVWKTWCLSSTSILHRASRITRLELACLENILCAKHLAGLVVCQKVLKISPLVLIFHVVLVCMESLSIDIRPKLFAWNNMT